MSAHPKGLLHNWHASSSFRMALCFCLLVLGILGSTFTVYYLEIVGQASQQLNEFALHTSRQLLQVYEQQGAAGLRQAIETLLANDADTRGELLIFQNQQGHVWAGNAIAPGKQWRSSPSLQDLWIEQAGQPALGRMMVLHLGNAQYLLVGSNLQPWLDIRMRFFQATGGALLLVLLISLVAAVAFHRWMKQRVADLRHTMHQAGQGNLQCRLTINPRSDEISQLAHDINAMLEQLEQYMHGIRHVSTMVAHNLRTPLTRTLAHLSSAREGPKAQRQTQLRLAQEELQALSRLLTKMLHLAEMESGMGRQGFERMAWHAVVQEVLEFYAPVLQDCHAQLHLSLDEQAWVLGDSHLLANALSNLIDNALKYGADSRGHLCLELTLYQEAEHAVLRVRDYGQGVPDDALPRLGQHFFRAATHQQLPGHGIGLASLLAITRLHLGHITWRNAQPGLETKITLPMAPPHKKRFPSSTHRKP